MPPLPESGERPHTQVDSGPVSEKKCPDFISCVCVFADGTDDQSTRSSLEKRCEHLQKQVWEMEVGFEGTFFIQGVVAKVIDGDV